MPYEYDDEGGRYYVPDPATEGQREHTACPNKACRKPGTAMGVWYNDETSFDMSTFKHDDQSQDAVCDFTKHIVQGARI